MNIFSLHRLNLATYNYRIKKLRWEGCSLMRIYAVADIHGKQARIERIRKVLLDLKPDVLVIAGDITNYRQAQHIIEQLNQMPVPVLAIRGNSDLPRVDRLLDEHPNTSSLDLREQIINGVKFAGASGTIPVPFSSRISLREQKALTALTTLVKEDSVLVVHSPPRGILDEAFGRFHAGSQRLHQLILQRRPRLVICGHIHERPGVAFVGRTTVVNCGVARRGNGATVDFDPEGSFKVEML